MLRETLISDSMNLSVTLFPDIHTNQAQSEFDRISHFLQLLCDRKQDHLFILHGKAHYVDKMIFPDAPVTTRWTPSPSGAGGTAVIMLIPDKQRNQRVRLEYKLTRLESPLADEASLKIAVFR